MSTGFEDRAASFREDGPIRHACAFFLYNCLQHEVAVDHQKRRIVLRSWPLVAEIFHAHNNGFLRLGDQSVEMMRVIPLEPHEWTTYAAEHDDYRVYTSLDEFADAMRRCLAEKLDWFRTRFLNGSDV